MLQPNHIFLSRIILLGIHIFVFTALVSVVRSFHILSPVRRRVLNSPTRVERRDFQQAQVQTHLPLPRSNTSSRFPSSSSLYGRTRPWPPSSRGNSCSNNNNNRSVNAVFQRLRPLLQQKQPPNNSLGILVWSYPPDGSGDNEPENDQDKVNEPSSQGETVGYDGLYEFLTRRTGEQAGESERQRKRDRIMEWMKSSKSSSSAGGGGGANLVQPIRIQDGQVDAELANEGEPSRTKAKFDQLFAGMPSLEEILTKSDTGTGASAPSTGNEDSGRIGAGVKRPSSSDDSWFEPERQKIEQEYRQIRDDLKEKIRQQRAEDPEGIPDNAEGIVEAIVKQEMERMIDSVKLTRAKERLQDYEVNKLADLRAKDFSGATDAVVEQILKEAAEDWERRDKLQEKADQFYEYEIQQKGRGSTRSDDSVPLDDIDLDGWALERLEEMLEASQKREDDDGFISDILEDNIEDLRKRIEKESKKGSIRPTTMKEWQMYRAIATRLAKTGAIESADTIINEDEVDAGIIAERLSSWREYMDKEDDIRKRSGLSSGPKLPFDFLGEKADQTRRRDGLTPAFGEETKTRRELRRDVNIQAIQAMEDLIRKSDSIRAEGLKKELEALKAELEPRDFHDIEEEVNQDPKSLEPIDLSDVFRRSGEDLQKEPPATSLSKDVYAGVNKILSNTGVDGLYGPSSTSIANQSPTKQIPPNTSFFSESFEEEAEKKAPPPNTPFFQDEFDTGRSGDEVDISNKLGSLEEQKLQAMYRRAGARTKAEQDRIRREWEEFQQFEKERRDRSGLSQDADTSSLSSEANLKYDISDVMTNDGDFDAEKILSSIGPRPSKRSKGSKSRADSIRSDAVSDVDELESDVSADDVADSIFRSVSAVGGGISSGDPDLQKIERSQFDEYLAKEEELRRNLDKLDENAAEVAKSIDVSVDDVKYAEDVLNSIGSRPVFKKRRKEPIDERKLSDMGGVRSDIDFDDGPTGELPSDSATSSSSGESAFDDIVPAWLKKEREAAAKSREESDAGIAGSSIDEVFDDDTYEKNLRQLHEYEQRRSGRKQMGIDISDIFGRRGSDDYVDYTYDTDYFRDRQGGWGARNFKVRKENLLQYIELDPAEVNSLMAQKESVYATGVSQYLPRINKPFKEFGAIFRLEGVLVDIMGLQQKVWKRVAAEFDFKEPLSEDVQRAAVTRPETVIREIFFRMNDIVSERKVVDAYRRIFREEFDAWVTDKGIEAQGSINSVNEAVDEKGSLAIGFEDTQPIPVVRPPVPTFDDEAKRLKYLKEQWTKTAKQFGFSPPTNEQIAESSILTPDIAVQSVFGWSSDPLYIDQIVAAYSILQAGHGPSDVMNLSTFETAKSSNPQDRPGSELSEGELLELQYIAWKKVAEANFLDVPDPEEILAAAVLNDPEAVVMSGFGWTEDSQRASFLAQEYRQRLAESLGRTEAPPATIIPKSSGSNSNHNDVRAAPSDEEIISSQIEAWKKTAEAFEFSVPSIDRIQLVMNANPNDAVSQLLLMDYDVDADVLDEITEFYTEVLQKASMKFMERYKVTTKTTASLNDIESRSKAKVVSSDEVFQAAFDAWTSVAWKNGYSLPDQEQVQFAMSVGPQQAILAGFRWTSSEEEAESIAGQYLNQIKVKRDDWVKRGYTVAVPIETGSASNVEDILPVRVMPGVVDWIQSLRKVEMACGVVSHLEKDQMRVLLDHAGLSDLLPEEVRVSHSNGYPTDSQQLLGAALRIERRPDHCVAFDTCPYGSVAAHDVDMRSVSLVGPYPRYELLSADTTSSSIEELTAMNIRRLFGERVYDQPELDMKSRQPETNKKVKTAYDWDDD
jgi:beta-phosphoglucomutase-like phosphatase (HAD superfamily)